MKRARPMASVRALVGYQNELAGPATVMVAPRTKRPPASVSTSSTVSGSAVVTVPLWPSPEVSVRAAPALAHTGTTAQAPSMQSIAPSQS
jgi:hypothetical protein